MKNFVVMILLALLSACAPTERDNQFYEQLETMKPPELAAAKQVFSWRGFTNWSDGYATRQCAIVIYDASKTPYLEGFMKRSNFLWQENKRADRLFWESRHIDIASRGHSWQVVGDPESPVSLINAKTYYRDEIKRPLQDAQSFCHMPEKKFASFASGLNHAWQTNGARVLLRSDRRGGGTAFDMSPPSDGHFFAVFDPNTRRLYMWMQVYPHWEG